MCVVKYQSVAIDIEYW